MNTALRTTWFKYKIPVKRVVCPAGCFDHLAVERLGKTEGAPRARLRLLSREYKGKPVARCEECGRFYHLEYKASNEMCRWVEVVFDE